MIARTTVQHVIREDYLNTDTMREIERFDSAVEERMSDQNFMIDDPDGFYIQDELDELPTGVTNVEENYGDMLVPEAMDADDIDDEILDKYLNAELIFDVGTGSERKGRVVKRAKGTPGDPMGWSRTFEPPL